MIYFALSCFRPNSQIKVKKGQNKTQFDTIRQIGQNSTKNEILDKKSTEQKKSQREKKGGARAFTSTPFFFGFFWSIFQNSFAVQF